MADRCSEYWQAVTSVTDEEVVYSVQQYVMWPTLLIYWHNSDWCWLSAEPVCCKRLRVTYLSLHRHGAYVSVLCLESIDG